MSARASLFLAGRYLRPKRSFVSLITFLSVLGPVLGVAVLIVVIAVMTGFGRQIRSKIFGMQAHLQLRPLAGEVIEDPEPILQTLDEMGLRATPTVEGPVLVQTRRQIHAKFAKGIQPATDRQVTVIEKSTEGKYELAEDEALLGRDLANELGLGVGDKLVLHATGKLQSMVRFDEDNNLYVAESDEVYVPDQLTVVGIFALGMYDYDANFIIVHLDKANELFDMPWGSASVIQVWTPDPFRLDPVVDRLFGMEELQGLWCMTWMQANRRLFEALQVEKNMQFFLLIIIVVVAAFSITGTLITVVVQKTREIGVLKAMGATPLTVLQVFVLQGAMVGLVGVGLGVGLGLLIVEQRNRIAAVLARATGIEIFPASLYQLEAIPAYVDRLDVTLIALCTFAICVLAATVPAVYAASMTPSNALRTEVG